MRRSVPLSLVSLALLTGVLAPASAQVLPEKPDDSCREVLGKPTRASKVLASESAATVETVARLVEGQEQSRKSFETLAEDPTMWVSSCGQLFAVEPAVAGPSGAPASRAQAAYPLSSTFNLSSLPGADKTIYLNFVGDRLEDGGWVDQYNNGSALDFGPYSQDSDPSFSPDELYEIQLAYEIVAEDFAPFAVNVTTAPPPPGALTRDYPGDPVFGITSLISSSSSIAATCKCGGLGFVGITKPGADLEYYSPALVFATNLQNSGENIGEASSHELGHNLGLSHDGTSSEGYYNGSYLWGPIMGVSYASSQSQWSKGEYADANNKQDDLSIIASSFNVRPDDHGEAVNLTRLESHVTTEGVLSSATDIDGFTFSAKGKTRIVVEPRKKYSNVDVKATLINSQGQVVSVQDPAVKSVGWKGVEGAGAEFDLNLPSDTYRLLLQATGANTSFGSYPAYGALGNYSVTVRPTLSDPVVVEDQLFEFFENDIVDVKLKASGASGGPYSWTWTGQVPPGLTLTDTGRLYGQASSRGTYLLKASVSASVNGVESSDEGDFTFRVYSNVVMPPEEPEEPEEPEGPTEPPATLLAFDTSSKLPNVKLRGKYAVRLHASGGTEPYSWSKAGKLPKGLRFVKRDGYSIVKGNVAQSPKVRGLYRFTVTVMDDSSAARRTFKLRVK